MGKDRPRSTKCWLNFLEAHGWALDRIKGSHHQYIKGGALRPIPVWAAKKEIPFFHIKTGLRTMGISNQDFYAWEAKNC